MFKNNCYTSPLELSNLNWRYELHYGQGDKKLVFLKSVIIRIYKQAIHLISFTNFNAQFLFFNNMYVTLQSSTCFEHQHAHLQEDELYYHSIWYRHSLYSTVQYAG